MDKIAKFFELEARGSNIRTELVAGLTTFLAMAYITIVNPVILSETGMDFGAVFVATCIAAAFGSIVMGLVGNYPIAQAPGMGQNAFFAYGIVLGLGYTWQTALGAVFLSGIIFIILSYFNSTIFMYYFSIFHIFGQFINIKWLIFKFEYKFNANKSEGQCIN